MPRKGVLAVSIVLLAAIPLASGPARAQSRLNSISGSASYFPLRVGNQWVYSKTGPAGTSSWKAEVTERVTAANGRLYFSLAGYFFGPRRLVRSGLSSVVTEFNPDGLYDNLWYLLGAPVGTSWQLQLEPLPILSPVADCVSGSKLLLASRSEVVKVPAGEFSNVVRVDFRSPCADAGIASEWFAPGVGLVRRVENSFAGPIVSELVQAEVGDLVLPRLPYSTTLGLDSPVYVNDLMPIVGPGPDALPTVRGAFTLRNRTSIPVEFTFGGCKSVSIAVLNEKGEVVLRARGDDGGCCLCDSLLPFTLVNGALVLPVSFKLATPEGRPLPDGRYSVTATLNSLEAPALRPSASARIEVRSIY